MLVHPHFKEKFLLTTGASEYAIGAVLSQGKIGKDRLIYSHCFARNESSRKELLYFLERSIGNRNTITQHRPLVWLNAHDPGSRVTRWRLKLLDYQFDVL